MTESTYCLKLWQRLLKEWSIYRLRLSRLVIAAPPPPYSNRVEENRRNEETR